MNYLAHAVLGGVEPEVALGNFIADAVKGSSLTGWSPGVADGIRLHRAIDQFADDHPASVHSRGLLRPWLGKMSGVGLDLLHDHFLARDFEKYALFPGGLEPFACEIERVLLHQLPAMPERSSRFFLALKENGWLTGYAEPTIMQAVCEAMDRRIAWPSALNQTLTPLKDKETARLLLTDFEAMWQDMQEHLKELPGQSLARVARL